MFYWSLYKISMCASIMLPSDFYKLLVEVKFIDPSNIKSSKYNQQMKSNVNNDKPDGVKYDWK